MVRNYIRKTVATWSEEELEDALENIYHQRMTLKEASVKFVIPKATLHRHYKKFYDDGGLFSPKSPKKSLNKQRRGVPLLAPVEEDVFAKTIFAMKELGLFEPDSTNVRKICFEYCEKNGIQHQFKFKERMASRDWFYGFCKRHPEVFTPRKQKPSRRSTKRRRTKTEDTSGSDTEMVDVADDEEASTSDVPANTVRRTRNQQKNTKGSDDEDGSDDEESNDVKPNMGEIIISKRSTRSEATIEELLSPENQTGGRKTRSSMK